MDRRKNKKIQIFVKILHRFPHCVNVSFGFWIFFILDDCDSYVACAFIFKTTTTTYSAKLKTAAIKFEGHFE